MPVTKSISILSYRYGVKLTPIIKRDIAEITKLGTDESESYGRNTGAYRLLLLLLPFSQTVICRLHILKEKKKSQSLQGTRSVPATKAIKRSGKVQVFFKATSTIHSYYKYGNRPFWLCILSKAKLGLCQVALVLAVVT